MFECNDDEEALLAKWLFLQIVLHTLGKSPCAGGLGGGISQHHIGKVGEGVAGVNLGGPHHSSGTKASSLCPVPHSVLMKEDISLRGFPVTAMLIWALDTVSRFPLTIENTSS